MPCLVDFSALPGDVYHHGLLAFADDREGGGGGAGA